jgi:hypothetical protein
LEPLSCNGRGKNIVIYLFFKNLLGLDQY